MSKIMLVILSFIGAMVGAYTQYSMFGVYCVVFIVAVHFVLFHHEI